MRNLAALIIRLEKRVIALEKALGIEPDKANLMHPKSRKHADLRTKTEAESAKVMK